MSKPPERNLPASVPPAPESARKGTGRLIGVDAARGLAVLGMCLVHVSPTGGPTWILRLCEGRSAALFAVLAGVSLAILSGSSRPRGDMAATRLRIVVRATILMVLGLALTLLDTSVMVILCYYARYFLLCLPLLRLRAPILAGLAAGTAIVGPITSFAIRSDMTISSLGGAPTFETVTDVGGTLKLLFLTGAYPVITWIPFVLAGLALGRLGLHTVRPERIALAGGGLIVLGLGGSWFAQSLLGGRDHLLDLLAPLLAKTGISADQILDSTGFGTTPTSSWWYLTLDNPHSGTPFEIIGSTGSALLVIGAFLLVSSWHPARSLLRPLIATGAMALTSYCLHIVLLAVFPPRRTEGDDIVALWGMSTWLYYLLLIGIVISFAMLWMARFKRGPLESVVHFATSRIRVEGS